MARLQDLRWRYLAVLALSTAVAVFLAAVNQLGASDASTAGEEAAPVASERATEAQPSLFTGIEQHGAALGSPLAPVTLVEYADLQCPYCAQWAHGALPTLIDRYVRTGKLRIVFRGLAFIGPDSETALRTAVAAGEQNHLWDVVHGLFTRQGSENAGWVSDLLITEIVAAVPGLDGATLFETRTDHAVERRIEHAAHLAQEAGVRGTPTFQVGPTGGRLDLVDVSSLDANGLIPAIEAVLAR